MFDIFLPAAKTKTIERLLLQVAAVEAGANLIVNSNISPGEWGPTFSPEEVVVGILFRWEALCSCATVVIVGQSASLCQNAGVI